MSKLDLHDKSLENRMFPLYGKWYVWSWDYANSRWTLERADDPEEVSTGDDG